MTTQPINAGAKPAAEGLCLPPGRILQQVPGTVAYDADGKALGIVGRDVAPQLVVQLVNGTIRPLTPAEARAVRGWRL
jgi:hypothetical protein